MGQMLWPYGAGTSVNRKSKLKLYETKITLIEKSCLSGYGCHFGKLLGG